MSEHVDPREQLGEHGEWDALAVGWALSALDPADEELFAGHLPGCARCTATVRESLYTVADLAYALPDEAPPPALKSRLMAAVAAEPRRPGGAPAAPEVQGDDGADEPEEEWPLGEPHPGSPGYGVDWFAKSPHPSGPAEPTGPPIPGDRRGEPGDAWSETPEQLESGDRFGGPADRRVGGRALGDRPTGPADDAPFDQPVADSGERPVDAPDRPAGPIAPDDQDIPPVSGYRGGELHDSESSLPGRHLRPEEPPADADVVPLASRRRHLGRRIGIGVAAAAVIALIAGLLVSNVRLRDDQDELRQIVAQREAAIQQLTANGPARVAALTANGQPSPTRQATLVVRGDQVEIIIEGLDATTADERYWLWTLRCDTPEVSDLKPIRGFTVTQPEFSVRDIGSDPGVAGATCFAISSEVGTATPKTPRQVVAVGQPK